MVPLAASAIAICLVRPCTRPCAMVRFIRSRVVITGSFTNSVSSTALAVKARTMMSRCDPLAGWNVTWSTGRTGSDWDRRKQGALAARESCSCRLSRTLAAARDIRARRPLTSRYRQIPDGRSAPPTSQGQSPSRRSHSTVEMIRLDRPSASSITRRASSRARPMQ